LPRYVPPPKRTNLSEPWCQVCGEMRPGGPDVPLPYGWTNHCVDSKEYVRGYWLPLTCSDACRTKGGYRR